MGLVINEKVLREYNFKGKGGQETKIISCFLNNLIKVNETLFDCIDVDTKEKYELKKQKNSQWFDPRKFSNLSEDDKKIMMVFLLYNSTGFCDVIATIKLGDFVNLVFTKDHLNSAKQYAKKFPKDQIKSGIAIRDFIKENKSKVKILWNIISN